MTVTPRSGGAAVDGFLDLFLGEKWDLTSRNLGIFDFWAHFLELVELVFVFLNFASRT